MYKTLLGHWIGLDLIGPSSQCSKHLCIFGLYVLCKCFKENYTYLVLHFTL